ncbi:MAG TPA: BMP family ABC transporter substrate-binding protein [Candidatus Micrarchaeia archaeon]|nr:BMP family ABC transporter substrate-binding protein [Candidatus Micrarchaeia archaeon]
MTPAFTRRGGTARPPAPPRRRRADRTGLRLAVGSAILAVVATGCGAVHPAAGTAAGKVLPRAGSFLGCMVTDTGGIDDRSFNASSWQGMQAAHTADHAVAVKYLQSTSSSDYVPNINAFERQKCGIIVTVGFLMGTATEQAAKAHPKQDFAIVDYTYTPKIKNILGLYYHTDQDAFLGGYLAAAMSKSKVVGTFGGDDIPTVTIYMSGFVAGVRYYNLHHHAHVKVLGWNPNKNRGTFTGSFTNQAAGKIDTETMIHDNADIIFPVAGSVGLGAAAAVKAAGPPHAMEWVDVDGCVSAHQYCSIFITSVTKGIVASVKAAVLEAAHHTFRGGVYNGTLANDGVGLSPFHDFAGRVPHRVKATLNQLRAGIIAGRISVNPLKYPAST